MAKRRILIVHDDTVVATRLEQRLTGLGFAVTGTAGWTDAPDHLASAAAPDLLVIDLSAQGNTHGIAAADALVRRTRTPALVMIAEADAATPVSAHIAGYDTIVAPVSDRELRTTMELAVYRHDSARVVHDLEHRFFATAIDMVCCLGYNGYFKWLNPAWERTLGFTRQELMAKPFIEFVHPDDRERTLKQNRDVRGGGQALSFENRYLCKDGSYRWFRWNAAPDSDERVIYSVARDVTAAREAEDERERLLLELRSALAEVKTLRGILPICSYCRKVRDDGNYWHTVENYVEQHTSSQFSHSICPSCMESEIEPQLRALEHG